MFLYDVTRVKPLDGLTDIANMVRNVIIISVTNE